ncbi:MAG: hypothetical protein J6J18_05880 [Oscillospiraceae bacterium]|nr:hypothetical protein [Oscillospiraceae bacterium]
MNKLIAGGLVLNSALILINRYVYIPDIIFIPLMIVGIGCMIIGLFLKKS